MPTKMLLYKSLISPHVDFCSSILLMANEMQLNELQLQNRTMRAILNETTRSNIDNILHRLNFLSIRQRIIFNVLAMIYKMKLGLLPPYLSQNLQYVHDVQPYKRPNSKFRSPAFTSNTGQKSLFYKGVSLYNQMMDEIVVDDNLISFKKNLIEYVKHTF